MEQEITSLKICMQKLETTLEFLKEHQKENTESNDKAHREIIDKIDAWMDNAEKNYARKWVEDAVTKINDKKENRNYNLVIFLTNLVILIVLGFIGIKAKI